jgi:hypothetical protein
MLRRIIKEKDRIRRISTRPYAVEIFGGRHGFGVRLPELAASPTASPTKASARLPHFLVSRESDLYRDTDGIYS